jgi:RNA polymerase sigma-70 factor (ECF subfamily)
MTFDRISQDKARPLPEAEQLQAGIDPEEIFRQLFHKHYRAVISYFLRRGISPDESEDLTQETFLRIYKSLPTFRGESDIGTWLFHIMMNVYKNYHRTRAARKRDAQEVSLEEPGASEPRDSARKHGEAGPLDGVLADERLRILHEALEDLPPQMRRCVLLRIDQDLKYREIADLMRVSVETVKAHTFQARQILKAKLGDYFSDLSF